MTEEVNDILMTEKITWKSAVRLCIPVDFRAELKEQARLENRTMVGLMKEMLRERKSRDIDYNQQGEE